VERHALIASVQNAAFGLLNLSMHAEKPDVKRSADTLLLEKYVPLVGFLGDLFGSSVEVVLHNLEDLSHSIIAIANGHLSGRKRGGPATNLVLQVIKEKKYLDDDFTGRYKAISKDGKIFNSSTLFIKNRENKLIGCLCINQDLTNILSMQNYLRSILGEIQQQEDQTIKTPTENLNLSLDEITQNSILNVLLSYHKPISHLTGDDKADIIKDLYSQGIFLFKGAVRKVARALKSSEASIYRYLQKIRS
jgi:predicted transcriptional regulator YheO